MGGRVSSDSRPYRGQAFGQRRTRLFRLVATGYDKAPLTSPVAFDPEIILEKGGEP